MNLGELDELIQLVEQQRAIISELSQQVKREIEILTEQIRVLKARLDSFPR